MSESSRKEASRNGNDTNSNSVNVGFPDLPQPEKVTTPITGSEPPRSESEKAAITSPALYPVVPTNPTAIRTPKNITRHALAYILVGSFFLIAGLPLFGIFGGGDPMETKTQNAVEWLKGVSAYLAGLVGAVIGYYYRSEVEKEKEK